jgi:MoxR-like ATPase
MTTKRDFSSEEWRRILAAPMVAGAAITAADPSGLWGLMKEGMAGGWALLEAKQHAGAHPLASAIAEDFATGDARAQAREHLQTTFKGAGSSDVKTRAIDELRSVASLLRRKSPAEAEAFTEWLQEVALKVAEAAKEGGILGVGGVAVSDAERATVAEMATALAARAPADERDADLPENSKENLDRKLDHAIDETFPTSDPVSVKTTR